ncbi:MAG: hypothetical protein IPQ07_40365 [Myxococcales bacterium]|nr:hypothetical protein [Myxococcales bacterium]
MPRLAYVHVLALASALASSVASCVASGGTASEPTDPNLALAAQDAVAETGSGWDVGPTLHVGERVRGHAAVNGRRVYPVWIAGSSAAPVPLDVVATAADGSDVRIAVLGPLRGGTRPVLGAGGYAQPRGNVELSIDVATAGEHLIVVGAFDLASESAFDVATHCETCEPGVTDILAAPKAGALVGTGDRILHGVLGDVLADRTDDVALEVWAYAPAHPAEAQLVATSIASGSQVNVILPPSLQAGDDLLLVVRDPSSGAMIDSGVLTRFAPDAAALVRTDALIYGDTVSLTASGIVGVFEGRARMSLRSEAHHLVIDETSVTADRPGQVGNGWTAFDTTFAPELTDEHGTLNPALPRNGDLLSIGTLDGNGGYRRLGCFEYCNDLTGHAACSGGTRSCPTTAW